MGCGCSSLKGDDLPNVNSAPTTTTTEPGLEPARRVNTNFSAINYEQDSHGRRLTEYAPDETLKPKSRPDSTAGEPARSSSSPPPQLGRADVDGRASDSNAATTIDMTNLNGTEQPARTAAYPHEASATALKRDAHNNLDGDHDLRLKPYQTIDGGDWDQNQSTQARQQPHLNGVLDDEQSDPTSSLAKDEFATSNDPAALENQESKHNPHRHRPDGLSSNGVVDERKKSWLGRKYSSYQQTKRGQGVSQISDEELKKYTGRDRAELKEWAETQPGIAGGQPAGRIGTDSAQAGSAPHYVVA